MIDKDGGTIFGFYGGDTGVMRGDIELMGGPPSTPTRENSEIFNSQQTCKVLFSCRLPKSCLFQKHKFHRERVPRF